MMRREALVVALLATATFLAYVWSAHFWLEPIDEGYFLDLADRVTRGEVPYRDFTTYYTPGIFYLFAASFKLFGANLLWPRYLMALLRAAALVLTYGLTRRVTPWPFALLPFLALALLDHWPIEPEPHPSWPAIVLCLATMECVVRHFRSGRPIWLALAGLAAALSFLFKQNIGAFTAIALGGYIVLRPRVPSSGALKLVQALFAVVAGAAVTVLMLPALDPLFAACLLLPVLAALALAVWPSLRTPSKRVFDGVGPVIGEGLLAAAVFGAVTVAWIVPLAAALGGLANVPFALFLGSVNEASIASPFFDMSGGIRALALVAIWLPVLLVRTRQTVIAGLVLTALVPVLPILQGPRDPVTFDPQLVGPVGWLDDTFGTLHVYLPAFAAWAGVAAVAASKAGGPTVWYLLFGVFAALTIYPRSDTLHALVAGPPIFVAGAYALARVWCSVRRPIVLAALAILPVIIISPQVAWRFANLVAPEKDHPRLAYASLDMARAPVLVPALWASNLQATVAYIDSHTSPGDPLVAYPLNPIFNFLTERPNPTRFDHFIPGTLTDSDFSEIISEMEQARPRYVIWDHLYVVLWQTDPLNRPLSDYIWTCYREVQAYDRYLIMERRDDACEVRRPTASIAPCGQPNCRRDADWSSHQARDRARNVRRKRCNATNATPSATGSSEMHTVGSSVLPPPPLPISLASVHTLASRSGRPDRSIPSMVAIRSS